MRANFEPFFRASVGYDSLLKMLEAAGKVEPPVNGPAYNIVKSGDDTYRIVIALPGYRPDDIIVTQHDNLLMVTGRGREEEAEYLHRGLSTGAFESRFQIAHHVQVVEANLNHGLLAIGLRREIPEAMKPRAIPIATPEDPRDNTKSTGRSAA